MPEPRPAVKPISRAGRRAMGRRILCGFRESEGHGEATVVASPAWRFRQCAGGGRRAAAAYDACWMALSCQGFGPTGRTNVQYSSNLTGSLRLP
jgi:hypothetical protein